jgi:hypothetical protein
MIFLCAGAITVPVYTNSNQFTVTHESIVKKSVPAITTATLTKQMVEFGAPTNIENISYSKAAERLVKCTDTIPLRF